MLQTVSELTSAGSYEHGHELSNSIKYEEFFA